MAVSVDRLLDLPLPTLEGDPAEVTRRRAIAGGSVVGVAISLVAVAETLAFEQGVASGLIAVFGLGCLVALILNRTGASTMVLRVYGMGLVCVFLVAASLQVEVIQWVQLKWLVLVPLLAQYLWDPVAGQHPDRRSLAPLAWGVALASALGVVIWLLTSAGVTANAPAPEFGTWRSIGELVDNAMFVSCVAGLVAIHQRSLRKAAQDVQVLRSLLAMCSWCRRIRDDEDGWISVERYVDKQGAARLTHGICPDCARKTFGEEV